MDGTAAVTTTYVIDVPGLGIDHPNGRDWHRILVSAEDARALYLALNDVFEGAR